jgi:nitrite reductase (NO-forming)
MSAIGKWPVGKWRVAVCCAGVAAMVSGGCTRAGEREAVQGEEVAVLTDAPQVPPPITRDHPTRVIVNLEVLEVVKPLADGVEYSFWTFGGSVPGKFIRVREGDEVEFNLNNHPSSRMPHNIDLHAVTGPGGGAAASMTPPGHASTFSFKAINPGLYVYHCATAPVGMHVANGMYGLILVEPRGGLPPVDREYYVMQSEFYTTGKYGEAGLQPFSMEKAIAENPDYVVFNGAVGALSGDRGLQANAGETVRLYMGNGGPNLVSSFHVIGEIFDRVLHEGGTMANTNVQTTLIPAGGSTVVEFRTEVPGTFILVDHAIFRAFNKGALATLVVDGPADTVIYSGRQSDEIYQPEGGAIQSMTADGTPVAPPPMAATMAERIAQGQRTYAATCAACHQLSGQGLAGAFPPLAASDYLNADKQRAISTVLFGLTGAVVVNGESFNSVMPALAMSDAEVASVLTYVYNNWDNAGFDVTPAEVQAVRQGGPPVSAAVSAE